MTEKQKKYINRLFDDVEIEDLVKFLFITRVVGKDVQSNLSDLTIEDASKVIKKLLSITCDTDDNTDYLFEHENHW